MPPDCYINTSWLDVLPSSGRLDGGFEEGTEVKMGPFLEKGGLWGYSNGGFSCSNKGEGANRFSSLAIGFTVYKTKV